MQISMVVCNCLSFLCVCVSWNNGVHVVKDKRRNNSSPGVWDERENRGAGTCTKANWREGMLGKQVPGCMQLQNGALTMRENDYQPLSPFAAQ